jgi:ABC-type dipeptide/oligopeptide/nickel transport system ATPase component
VNPILTVENLGVTSADLPGGHSLVDDVSFSVNAGTTLAIIGESGSGKTTLCRALTRLFPQSSNLKIVGRVMFSSMDLLSCDLATLQILRRSKIRYVFQEPQQALNPVLTIQNQIQFSSSAEITANDIENILKEVGLDSAGEVMALYPHQLSIGMAQRVMMAMAIRAKPSLLIADEPTSAVDASLRYRLLDQLKSTQLKHQMALILVTHDLETARAYADTIAVMRDGKFVEQATTRDFFLQPQHPYSQLLIDAMPNVIRRVQPEERAIKL